MSMPLSNATISTPIPPTRISAAPHVFSMSCKVTAVNGDLASPEGRAKAIGWWRAYGFTKLWLETYRHSEYAPTERLVEERDAFRAAGFEVCGLITPTMLNNAAPGKDEPQMVVCWSDPKARGRMRAEVARAAKVFDTVILDDFLFSNCGDGCPRCAADKAARGIADWGEYRRALLFELCERDILPAARAANPKAHFIIKYPCWYRNYGARGYDPARQADLFGECWVGTETRDANPEPLQACWIMAWMDALTGGTCGGGWYDALDCTPWKFVEQAYYTILGGARESLVHCYDYVLASDPGRTPFGEKAGAPGACREAFERESAKLHELADFLRGAERGPFAMGTDGVSTHAFRKGGRRYVARLNTTDKPVAGLPPHGFELKDAPDASSAATLRATHAAFTPDSASKFGCGRYRQEEHLLERCAEEIVRFGRRPLFVCDETSRAIAYDTVAASLAAEGIVPRVYVHGGFCCFDEALERAADGTLDGIDVVLGCGGGVVIDFAKCLADIASVPVVTMPTSSATCCAFTPIAPCYTREGQYVATALFRREVAAALLDMTILSRQPARLLLAGVCDAMAKKIEIEFWNSLPGSKGNAVATGVAELVSDRIYDVLDREADAAVADLAKGEPTRTLAEVVFASIVGAGIVSGISGGERQTALAHRFYFFSRLRWPEKATRRTHGELVAIGLVMQLAYYGRTQEAEAFAERLRGWGLPASVADLGVPFDPADAEACADYLAGTSEMRAAGPDALPRLRKSLEAVFAPQNI